MALRIVECRRHRMPAVQDHRSVGAGLAVAPGRPAAGFAASSGALAAAAPKMRLSIAIAHGPLVSRAPEYGNLDPSGAAICGRPWLTLQGCFPHKRANREPAIGSRH